MTISRPATHQTYVISFPDVSDKQLMTTFQALSGALHRPGRSSAYLVLEVWANSSSITHRLRVPKAQADYIVGQLRVHLPGVRVAPEPPPSAPAWMAGVELGLTKLPHRLRLGEPAHLAAALLASLSGLANGQTVLYQVVLAPAPPGKPVRMPSSFTSRHREPSWYRQLVVPETDSDDVNDRRAKASETNFLAVVRVVAGASTPAQADQLIKRVEAALNSTSSSFTRFKAGFVMSKSGLFKRATEGVPPLVYPAQLAVSEVAGVSACPIDRPHISGLPRRQARQLPATSTIPASGIVVGVSNFPGAERTVAVTPRHLCQNMQVLGPTGTGKSTAMANMAGQLMAQGHGVIVLESKVDLYRMVLERVPRRRIKDVIVLDVDDTAYPLGFNVLNAGTSNWAVDELSALIIGIYGDHGGVYAPMLLYYGLHALAATPGHTFIDLPALLTPQGPEEVAWRDQLVARLKNRSIRQFWLRYLDDKNKERDRMAAPVHNRIWQLDVRPETRNIIGQSRSSFTFEEVLTSRKIVLINLNGTRVGEATAALVGTLLMNALWSAVRTVKLPKPAFLFLDEFQDYVNLPVNAADMLAKCRSYGLGMVLGHQGLEQLSKVRGLAQAVLANAKSKLVFQTSAHDARVMQREFGRLVDEDDFINLSAYEALARLVTGDGVSPPISLTTEPPSRTTGVANAVLAASRARYGRPVAEVEAEIESRRRPTGEQQRATPKVGRQKWS
ncbi:type IV secretory system conjugative DNA transfer family protein [Actinophytocola algeriensis]|uniref:Energy-coupling factor transporter ATP-binding protein EcfA2 n=1 Tax=Actinophytocola algeriensis TaxID=1768010 RepID=A0A7W7QBL7_9PSEU|nr:type IV secretion system DNA-binding domain-containing protein [Actinophytocola algeriensis]MBB4910599.1 energy-coupling factor transporter ATP-binding protein EcfA2 [Actinophytocola algeriensis]